MSLSSSSSSFAGIELGGTSVLVAISQEGNWSRVKEKQRFPTTTPAETLGRVGDWLSARSGSFSAIGIGSFGPLDLRSSSKTFGCITTTPKPGWASTPVLGFFRERFPELPISLDTDVNAAALADSRRAPGESVAYVTVGTGVGVGAAVDGVCLHGRSHPEAGHLPMARLPGDAFEGVCPFHGGCVEGMCATGALARRARVAAAELPLLDDDDAVWDVCAHYLAQLCAAITLMLSPDRIVLGGGVMQRTGLLEKVRARAAEAVNGYVALPPMPEYITPSRFADEAGIVGAFSLCLPPRRSPTSDLSNTSANAKE